MFLSGFLDKEQYLFEIEILYNIFNVFTVLRQIDTLSIQRVLVGKKTYY